MFSILWKRFIFLGSVPAEADTGTEMIGKLEDVKNVLRLSLDPELSFSEARCEKILPDSHKAYLNSLPSHYTTKVHNNQIQQEIVKPNFNFFFQAMIFNNYRHYWFIGSMLEALPWKSTKMSWKKSALLIGKMADNCVKLDL